VTTDGPHWWPAYVGIGSNLNHPAAHVTRAFDDLGALPKTVLVARSSLYRSAPLGPQDQPDFINAAAALLTQLAIGEFLAQLHEIERQHGRDRSGDKWGPRTLDLDLLVYGTEVITGDELTLPHAGIAERNFVLLPLREIAPGLYVPGLGTVSRLLSVLPEPGAGIEKLSSASG